ncbi:hypothetical protein SAMN05216215_11205 [Saccharopolyspora shandongensis]|uniref:Virus ReqiPepy6 Gp37-like protein n=1 Tax=Saccharopolyspora shandongensis TaxID=418495 RepID=A0A1H3U9V9_9PSEU|nr:hypothetical protein [Saccharopolyspora shandongensis]SDZ59077.1 hypothetical protein SAMN05216215_11205 [Saccharopolyspora shandongensis]
MALPVYTYAIADLSTNTLLEEIPLSGVRFNKPLNSSGTFRATWKLDERSTYLDPYDLTMPTRRVIYAFRDSRPMWGGVIWSRTYKSESGTVDIGAGEFWSYFDHRKVLPVLPSTLDLSTVAALSTTYDNVEQNEIARQLIAQAQAHTGGDIGIEFDTSTSNTLRDRTYNGYDLTDVGEALRNLTNVDGGPDMVFDVLPTDSGAPRRILRIGTPWLGQQGSSHVWELGGNAIRYTWPTDGTRMASRAFATGEGVDLGTPIAVYEQPERYEQGFPVLELENNYSGAETEATLDGHAEADQQAARMPVVLPTIEVRGDIPPTAADINRGDDGWLVVPPDRFHRNGFEGPVRVIDMEFAPSADAERVTLTLAPLLDGVA